MISTTITDRWEQSVEQFPTRKALFVDRQSYTYAELHARVFEIAHFLQHQLSECDQCDQSANDAPLFIGLYATEHIDTYASLLAIWMCGGVVVPLLPAHPVERLAYMCTSADCAVILSATKDEKVHQLSNALFGTGIKVCFPSDATKLPADPSFVPRGGNASPDSPAYLLFTSGSTGQPKGVPVLHRNINVFLDKMAGKQAVYDFSPEDRFLQMFDLSFDLSFFSVLVPWCVGASTYIVPQQGIKSLNVIQMLEEFRLTVALMAPSVLAFLQHYFDEIELPHLRYSLFCGEPLIHHLVSGWKKCVPYAQIENVYGPTEATIFCSRYRWHPLDSEKESFNGIVPIGQPLQGMTFEISDIGELILIGDQVTIGYHKNETKTAAAFFTNNGQSCYRSGDLVSLSESGQFLFHGRIDQQVKIDGYRVELGEIEHHIRQYTHSDQVVVITKNNSAGTPALHAFIVGFQGEIKALRQYLAEHLPPYMHPSSITSIDAFPLNSNGKIDRNQLTNYEKMVVPG